MPKSVNTGVIARDLGLTERRVQQLVAEFVLPPPQGGKHDLELCAERYRLYRNPDGPEWSRHQREAEAEAEETERLVEAACAAGSTNEMITEASLAHQASIATLRFNAAVVFRDNDAARHYALKEAEELEGIGFGNLLHRSLEITAEQSGKSLEEVKAQFEARYITPEGRAGGDEHRPNRASRRAARHAGR